MSQDKNETLDPKNKMFYDKKIKDALEKAIDLNLPTLLVGETGTGKTSFLRELAAIRNIRLVRINLTGQTGVDEIVGKYLVRNQATEWSDGLLTIAMKNGYWVVLDELNMALPEILAKLHSLLDDDRMIVLTEKEGEVIKPHPDFRVFGAINPCDEYEGTKELNKALISRFPIILEVDYSDKEVEILTTRTGIDEYTANDLVEVAKDIRTNKNQEKITYTCSTRDLIYACQLIMQGLPKKVAYEIAIINKAHKDDRTALKKVFELITKQEFDEEGTKKYVSISEKIKTLTKQKEDYETENTKLKQDINSTKNKLDKVSQENKTLTDKISDLSDKIVKIKEQIKKLM